MCEKCSRDIGSHYVKKCKCKCHRLTYVDTINEGDVYGCNECRHLINGFVKPDEDYEDERYVSITKLQWIRKEVV